MAEPVDGPAGMDFVKMPPEVSEALRERRAVQFLGSPPCLPGGGEEVLPAGGPVWQGDIETKRVPREGDQLFGEAFEKFA